MYVVMEHDLLGGASIPLDDVPEPTNQPTMMPGTQLGYTPFAYFCPNHPRGCLVCL